MKDKLFRFLVTILAVVFTFSFVACNEDDGDENVVTGTFEYQYVQDDEDEVDGGYYKITGYNVNSDDVENDYKNVDSKYRDLVIPETAKDFDVPEDKKHLKVKEIGAGAFSGKKILTSVTIGDNIETIGDGAFAGCTNLKSMTIPFVGKSKNAFNEEKVFPYIFGTATNEDSGIISISVKTNDKYDSADASLNTADATVYYMPSSLKKVTITGGEIKESAFYGVSTLEEIILPSDITYIGDHAFTGCTNLKAINIPKTVKHIYQYAFSDCTALKKINFDNDSELTYIGKGVFSGCTKLGSNSVSTSIPPLKLPNITVLGEKAFEDCSSLMGIDLSNTSITVIDTSTFDKCSSLEKVILKDTMAIRTGAFTNCTKLKKEGIVNGEGVEIYDALTKDEGAFDKFE